MPAQLIRKVRDRRPSYQVGIDWGNPITAGLAFAFDAAYGKRDLVTGVTGGAAGAGIVPGIGRFGPQTTFSGTQADNSYEFGVHKGLFGATGTTFDILVYFSTGNQTSHFFGQWDGNDQEWLLQNSGGTLVWVAADDTMSGTNRTRFDLSSAFTNAGWYRIIAAWRGGTDRTLIINGVEKVPSVNRSNATAVSTTSLDKITIGKTVGGSALNGTVVFARAWRRGLTNGECWALSSAPWIIFPDETIPLFWTGVTAQSATASIAAAIRADRTASASLNAAIQSAATASATLSGAIQAAQSATSGLTAYIVASSARSSSASLSAAISDARTATSSLSAAVATARTATAALDSAIQIEATASTGASAAIREAFSLSANLSGAVQASATASASLAAIVATTGAISAGLSAAVRAEQTAFATLSAYIAADVVLTQAEVDMLTDIWQRFGLDPLAPLTETETSASFGGIVLSKSGTNTITSTRSGDSAAGVASSIILDVWQRLGLDPDNPMTASETQISAGTLSQARAVSGATVTVTRAP